MMKNYFKFAPVALVAISLSFASCSDNDDNDPNNPGATATPKPEQVFTQGIPQTYGDYNITTNAAGLVTEVSDDWDVMTFDYTPVSRATQYQLTITMKEKSESEAWCKVYCQLNNQGFISHALQVYDDGDEDTWDFTYNADGQLSKMVRSEGGDEVTVLTYTNGDVTKVTCTDEDGDYDEYVISYTDSNVSAAIDNKGGIMLFDMTLGVDMDEMDVAYIAGLLGKSTKHLPVRNVETGYEDEYETYAWTLNSNGLPTQMVATTHYSWGNHEDSVPFKW